MTRNTSLMALCSAVAIPSADGIPDWIHLLPAGEIRTVDGRGPYRVASMQALADASLKPGQKLPIDEVHATDRAAPLGLPAPARGWIVALEARDTGLWGQVDWNGSGKALMEDRAYAGISPVILHSKDGQVLKFLRASLTNTPNLEGLVALHSEEDIMAWKEKLLELLGLGSDADDAAIETALAAKGTVVAAHAQDLLEHPTVIALQAQNVELANEIRALKEGVARDKAVAFVDAAIAAGRVGVKPLRDDYIALHMSDPVKAEKMIAAQPILTGKTAAGDLPPENGEIALNETDRQIMATFGVSENDYMAGLKEAGLSKEAL